MGNVSDAITSVFFSSYADGKGQRDAGVVIVLCELGVSHCRRRSSTTAGVLRIK